MTDEVVLQCQNLECDRHARVSRAGADTLDAYGGLCMWCGEPTLWNATAGWRVPSPLEAHAAHLQRTEGGNEQRGRAAQRGQDGGA